MYRGWDPRKVPALPSNSLERLPHTRSPLSYIMSYRCLNHIYVAHVYSSIIPMLCTSRFSHRDWGAATNSCVTLGDQSAQAMLNLALCDSPVSPHYVKHYRYPWGGFATVAAPPQPRCLVYRIAVLSHMVCVCVLCTKGRRCDCSANSLESDSLP